MPELNPHPHGSPAGGGSFGKSSLGLQSHSISNSQHFISNHYPSDLFFRNFHPIHPILPEPSLQGLVETEVFAGEENENFLTDEQGHSNGIAPSSLLISYHKDTYLQPLNSVKEDIEAEAAEEEISGNFHSLDYLGLSLGPSSLSSSVISSVSLDDVISNGGDQDHNLNKSYVQMQTSNGCAKLQLGREHSLSARSYFDQNNSKPKLKYTNSLYHDGKSSPSTSLRNLKCLKNFSPNYCISNSHLEHEMVCSKSGINNNNNTPQKLAHGLDKNKVGSEKKNLVWHNPSKSDKILNGKKESSSVLKRYGFCRAKSEAKESIPCNANENKFNSLPRKKKKEKSEKDIVAETYGTLGKNRKKKEFDNAAGIPFSHKSSQSHDRNARDLPQDSKNILDKYATLPRKKAKEISARWRDSKESRPPLQRSKSTGKGDSARDSPTSQSAGSNCSAVSSPKPISSTSKPPFNKVNPTLKCKIQSPSAKLLGRQISSGKDRGGKSPSPNIYLSTKQPKLCKGSKKNVEVQVNIKWDQNESDLADKLRKLTEEHTSMQRRLKAAEANAEEVEQLRMEAVELRRTAETEKMEKEELQEELDKTSGKVKDMLTSMDGVEKEFNNRGESLIELENQLQNSAEINIKMQDRLNQYEEYTVKLRKDLDKSLAAQKILLQQVQDLEAEGREMVDFVAEEKNALSECLKESELELCRQRKEIKLLTSRLQQKDEEARHMVRLAEERRRDYMSLQTEMKSMQLNTQDMMVCQGAEVSGTSVGLTNLTSRLQILNSRLIQDYSISENDIENVVTPVDSDSSVSSSTNGTPDLQRSPIRSNRTSSPRKPVSFMQSFLNAMRTAQNTSKLLSSSLHSKNITQVLSDDRKSPDGLETQHSAEAVVSDPSANSNQKLSQSLLDQVGEVDLLITRFLKVCCVLKSDADNILSELEDENERLCNQIQLQQQMIDQQYAEFERVSTFESNARKELKLITKDLEFANETLNKVCDEDTKTQVKKVEEELEKIGHTLNRMDAMHAEKQEILTQMLQNLSIAQKHDSRGHYPNTIDTFNSKKRKPLNYPYILVSKCKSNRIEEKHRKLAANKKSEENNVSLDQHSFSKYDDDKELDVDYIADHVLKTLESVPEVVSSCPALKNLYNHLNATDPYEKDINCNPGEQTSTTITLDSSSNYSSLATSTNNEFMNGDNESPISNHIESQIGATQHTKSTTAESSSTSSCSTTSSDTSPNTISTNTSTNVAFANASTNTPTVLSDSQHNFNSEPSIIIGVDCNANPEIDTTEIESNSLTSNNVLDPSKFIPLLTNETSL